MFVCGCPYCHSARVVRCLVFWLCERVCGFGFGICWCAALCFRVRVNSCSNRVAVLDPETLPFAPHSQDIFVPRSNLWVQPSTRTGTRRCVPTYC